MHPWELQLLQLSTGLRVWLLESLADEDLSFALPSNRSIGELLVDLGRAERAHIDSFDIDQVGHGDLRLCLDRG